MQFDEHMACKKQLIVVREGSAALGGHWTTILSDYLQKLIRSFCGDDANPDIQLALVQFNVHDNNSPWLVQRGGWVTNVNYFLKKLTAIDSCGGRFCNAAITEGLSEVLTMFPPPNEDQTQQNDGFQRHCILIAASNPNPLPTQVYRPPDKSGTQSQSPFCDAETLVKSFPQSRVSLSVICPTQLLKLKSIYNAGKRNPSAADYTIDIVTNPHYLILISEDFKLALVNVNQLGLTTLPSNRSPSNTERTSVLRKSSTSGSSGWKSVPVQLYHHAPANDSSLMSMVGSQTSLEAAQVAQNTAHGLLISDISKMSWSAFLEMPQQPDLQERQFAQSETSMNKRRKVALIQSDIPAASTLQSSDSGYVRVWEGDLTCQRQNETVFLTRLRAFKKSTDPTLLAKDWPTTMEFDQVMTQDNVNKHKVLAKKVYRLAFLATNPHEILEKLRQRNVCAAIRLPSQELLLSISDPICTWIGTLFPNGMVHHEQQTSGQQPPPSQQLSGATTEG